jgi:ACT domain-containing protein
MAELSKHEIKKLAEEAVKQLGAAATPLAVKQVVEEAAGRIEAASKQSQTVENRDGNRIIVTAFGENKPGILAGLTETLANYQCDILDLTQKILQEFFTVMLLVDISASTASFDDIKSALTQKGEFLRLKVIAQHEEIFKTMHRI